MPSKTLLGASSSLPILSSIWIVLQTLKVALCASRVWQEVCAAKRSVLEEIFKRGFVCELNAARALLSHAASLQWLAFVDSQVNSSTPRNIVQIQQQIQSVSMKWLLDILYWLMHWTEGGGDERSSCDSSVGMGHVRSTTLVTKRGCANGDSLSPQSRFYEWHAWWQLRNEIHI